MRLSLDNGTVVCSLENKNAEFLHACFGIFDGFLNGKLKIAWEDSKAWAEPDTAQLYNAKRLEELLRQSQIYGIVIDDAVKGFNTALQSVADSIIARRHAAVEEREQIKRWERLCANGCGECRYLIYDMDLPICKKTWTNLEEKNIQKYIGGVLRLFNFEPFPSKECPFNINKNKEQKHECLSEACFSSAET